MNKEGFLAPEVLKERAEHIHAEAVITETTHLAFDVLVDVMNELVEARARFPAMRSAHEGWGILKEEVDELWDEVRKKSYNCRTISNIRDMRREAIQVAAMAIRFVVDVCDKEAK